MTSFVHCISPLKPLYQPTISTQPDTDSDLATSTRIPASMTRHSVSPKPNPHPRPRDPRLYSLNPKAAPVQANITLRQRKASDGRAKLFFKRMLAAPLGFCIHVGHRYLTRLMLVGIECAVEHYLGLVHSPQVTSGPMFGCIPSLRSAGVASVMGA